MSPRDPDPMHPDPMPPAEERALDALIASQADTSISEETADRLLSFLLAEEKPAASGEGVVPEDGSEAGTPAGPDADAPATASRRWRPVRIAASVAVALAVGAAALLLLHSPSNPDAQEDLPGTPIAPPSPRVAKDLPQPAVTPTASPALRVTGWGKRKTASRSTGDPILRAWSGRWVPGVDADDMLLALRQACADVQPWPEARGQGVRSQTRRAQRGTPRDSSLGIESLAALPGLSPTAASQRRVLLGTEWLLSRVERGAIPRIEIMEPARLLLTAEGRFRQELVRLFRESDVRVDRMLPPRGRTVPDPLAGLCGALGTSRATKVLARAGLRPQRQALVQSLRTGDEASLDFALDLLLLGHRLSPSSDKARLVPFESWEGDAWRVLQRLLLERMQQSSSHSERSFLDMLREHLLSKS